MGKFSLGGTFPFFCFLKASKRRREEEGGGGEKERGEREEDSALAGERKTRTPKVNFEAAATRTPLDDAVDAAVSLPRHELV